jgi:hypothetical protein
LSKSTLFGSLYGKLFDGQMPPFRNHISFVTEDADWSIRYDGQNIKNHLAKNSSIAFDLVTDCASIKDDIIHFGSRNTYLPDHYKNIDKIPIYN